MCYKETSFHVMILHLAMCDLERVHIASFTLNVKMTSIVKGFNIGMANDHDDLISVNV